MKVSIIYWSGTGNTEAMANTIKDGAIAKGAEVTATRVTDADDESLNADVILFGCPAMGAEQLEDTEFEPYFTAIESKLKGKKVGLFGSYGWGDGEWMRNWEQQVVSDGAILIADGVIANNDPTATRSANARNLANSPQRVKPSNSSMGYFACAQYDVRSPIGTSCHFPYFSLHVILSMSSEQTCLQGFASEDIHKAQAFCKNAKR